MNSREDMKQVEVMTSEDVVQDLGKQAITTKEKISAYFTIAAAAFGLISDGCKLRYGSPRYAVLRLTTQNLIRSEQSYDNVQRMRLCVLTWTSDVVQTVQFQVVFKRLYPKVYTTTVSTRVSNALLVGNAPFRMLHCLGFTFPHPGAIIGQLFVGLVCDRMGRKVALVFTTLLIVLGATLGTAAHGAHGSAKGLFWFLTFARGITGIVRAVGIV